MVKWRKLSLLAIYLRSSCFQMTILRGTQKEKKQGEVDRRKGGKTITKSGQELINIATTTKASQA